MAAENKEGTEEDGEEEDATKAGVAEVPTSCHGEGGAGTYR